MPQLVLIDTNILDCLLYASSRGETPLTSDPDLAAQQVATLRLYLWTRLCVGRVATTEVGNTPDEDKRRSLQSIIYYQLPELWVQHEDEARWRARAGELGKHHKGELDCQLAAEAEIVGATTLLSFDKTMVRKLRLHTTVRLMFPTEYWEALAIPRGTQPKWTPAPSNPLSAATFWQWE